MPRPSLRHARGGRVAAGLLAAVLSAGAVAGCADPASSTASNTASNTAATSPSASGSGPGTVSSPGTSPGFTSPSSPAAASPSAGVTSSPPGASFPAATPSEEAYTVDVTIAAGQVSPKPGRVEVAQGERVVLRVTSDRDDEVHVHGYDRTVQLEAGQPAMLRFTADQQGLFEVETHESHTLLCQLVVR